MFYIVFFLDFHLPPVFRLSGRGCFIYRLIQRRQVSPAAGLAPVVRLFRYEPDFFAFRVWLVCGKICSIIRCHRSGTVVIFNEGDKSRLYCCVAVASCVFNLKLLFGNLDRCHVFLFLSLIDETKIHPFSLFVKTINKLFFRNITNGQKTQWTGKTLPRLALSQTGARSNRFIPLHPAGNRECVYNTFAKALPNRLILQEKNAIEVLCPGRVQDG